MPATWFALCVLSRQEAFVARALSDPDQARPLAAYVPQHVTHAPHARRRATRTRPLIPGYVFAQLPDDEAILQAMAIRGVFDRVPVPPLAIGSLVLFEATRAFDETYEPPKPKGRRYAYRAGDQVRIVRGVHAGQVARIFRAKGKAKFEIFIATFERTVTIDGRDLQPLADRIAA